MSWHFTYYIGVLKIVFTLPSNLKKNKWLTRDSWPQSKFSCSNSFFILDIYLACLCVMYCLVTLRTAALALQFRLVYKLTFWVWSLNTLIITVNFIMFIYGLNYDVKGISLKTKSFCKHTQKYNFWLAWSKVSHNVILFHRRWGITDKIRFSNIYRVTHKEWACKDDRKLLEYENSKV